MDNEKPFVKNTASHKQVKEAGKEEKRLSDEHLSDLRVIMKTPEGRRIIFWLVNILCHYDSDDFNNSGSVTYYSLGERNIGRIMKSDCIEASHQLYQLAEQENWKFFKQGD